jgi:hypothetical protein
VGYSNHYYFVASLPLLKLGETPPFSSAEFVAQAERLLGEKPARELAAVSLLPSAEAGAAGNAARQWYVFETFIRNHLAKWRAAQRHQTPEPWLQPESDVFPGEQRQLDEVLNTSSDPLTRERGIDRLRWQFLEHLSVGHDFDFDALVIYRLRLFLAEKWEGWKSDEGRQRLDERVDEVIDQARSVRT